MMYTIAIINALTESAAENADVDQKQNSLRCVEIITGLIVLGSENEVSWHRQVLKKVVGVFVLTFSNT